MHDEPPDRRLLDGDGNAFAVHVVISAASDISVCNSLGGSMLWMVASTGTAGLAVGDELEAEAAMIEGGPSEPPPLPERWVSDREMFFCRRRRHPRKHASIHSNVMPAAGLTTAGESRSSASIQAWPSDMLLPSPSPDSGGGGNGDSSGGRGCGGGNSEGRSVAEGGGIGGNIGC